MNPDLLFDFVGKSGLYLPKEFLFSFLAGSLRFATEGGGAAALRRVALAANSSSGVGSLKRGRAVVGGFSRAGDLASSTQEITGIDFRIALAIFMSVKKSSFSISFGVDDGVTARCLFSDSATNFDSDTTKSIRMDDGGGAHQTALISLIANSSYTLTWTKTGLPGASSMVVTYAVIG